MIGLHEAVAIESSALQITSRLWSCPPENILMR
jgi:hypothetical protein